MISLAKKSLNDIGITKVFESESSEMINVEGPKDEFPFLTNIFHKCSIEMDEVYFKFL